jgi:proline dehydrogenase
MRSALLWMARNDWLRDHLPRLPGAQRAVRRFMPGEHLEDALAAADRLQGQGFGVLFTHLGEALSSLADADAVADHYHGVLERSQDRARPIEISVKPTQLGMGIDDEACYRHCVALAAHGAEVGTWFWLDMEGSDLTEPTIALYERVRADHARTGIALQAYLRRTAADIARLLPLEPAIRLVKGAYDEPGSIAWRSKSDVDASYLALATEIARAAGEGKARLCLGTHDTGLVEKITLMAEPQGVTRSSLEVHMLYGIREDELARLSAEGYPCFSLIAYGEAWYRWYMRRLAERPANVVFALRQLIP